MAHQTVQILKYITRPHTAPRPELKTSFKKEWCHVVKSVSNMSILYEKNNGIHSFELRHGVTDIQQIVYSWTVSARDQLAAHESFKYICTQIPFKRD